MRSQAAQEIFVACIVHLQATRGKDWGWADLEAVVTADVDRLTAYARDHNPNALRLLDQPDSKTTLSILTTFQTHMRIVSVLAEAWPDPRARRFSIRAWLHNPVAYRPLILQHDPGYPELSRIWIGSMLGLLASAVGSPTLTESRERRVWLFLEEFPQLPPIKQFPTFLEPRPLQGRRRRHWGSRHGTDPGGLWPGPGKVMVRHDRHQDHHPHQCQRSGRRYRPPDRRAGGRAAHAK
jgi:type IV secretion system coupling TraD/TrwB family protein